ncbi:hypothetical protein ENSA5_25580 [Enhygromyxa salina]|uniref:Uncharacterized protein n=1 Tax=Enhygromyxa salina TaxID=215803 RepID=A0A2S9YAU2_9BACT|nr:hypothetical protein ENSA5_25580 [Enhygromyxa salina]
MGVNLRIIRARGATRASSRTSWEERLTARHLPGIWPGICSFATRTSWVERLTARYLSQASWVERLTARYLWEERLTARHLALPFATRTSWVERLTARYLFAWVERLTARHLVTRTSWVERLTARYLTRPLLGHRGRKDSPPGICICYSDLVGGKTHRPVFAARYLVVTRTSWVERLTVRYLTVRYLAHELAHAVSCEWRSGSGPAFSESLAVGLELEPSESLRDPRELVTAGVAADVDYPGAGHFVRWLIESHRPGPGDLPRRRLAQVRTGPSGHTTDHAKIVSRITFVIRW